jgi:hypothetical protein
MYISDSDSEWISVEEDEAAQTITGTVDGSCHWAMTEKIWEAKLLGVGFDYWGFKKKII